MHTKMTKEILVNEFIETPVHGVSKAGAWTLYNVIDEYGTKYGTFEEKYKNYIGTKIIVDVEEKESKTINKNTGKPYMNWYIIEKKGAKKNEVSSQLLEKLFTKLTDLETKIMARLDKLEVKVDNMESVKVEEDIPPENIPF